MTLPIPLTRFVGREAELAEAAALLAATRLLTLTGPGGAGKTRLAIQLAADLDDLFPDGVWFVDLAPLTDGGFVWDQVAITLGVTEPKGGKTLERGVAEHLAQHVALVVLDNCEQVVQSAAEVAAGLLSAAPAVKLIATSREPLSVGGEVTWVVPPLSDGDGVELFNDRARQARPHFVLRERDAEAIRAICRHLDGLPLAIELAATRARAFAPADIAAGLRDRFELLPAGPRTAPARQATLQASFDWSYDLLSEPERALLRECSVFAGGFDLEAAIAVCPAAGLDVLGSLVDRSLLIVQDDEHQGGPRYRMLEAVRQFAARRLADAGEEDLVRSRHRDHYLQLIESLEPMLTGPDEYRWRARVHPERDNLRAALAWSRDQGNAEMLARMVGALMPFWMIPGRMAEFGKWVDSAHERIGDLSPRRAAHVLNLESVLALVSRQRSGQIYANATEALRLARAADDQAEEGMALGVLGLLAGLSQGAEAMRPYMEQAWPLARSTRSMMVLGVTMIAFMMLRVFQSDPDETRRLAKEAVALADAHADRHNRLFTSSFASMEALVHGRLTEAAQIAEKVVEIGRPTNDSNFIGSLLGLAWVALFKGDFETARKYIAEAVPIARQRGTDSVSITSVDPLSRFIRGWMELAEGDAASASQTLSAVVASARSSIIPRFASLPIVVLAEAQAALGENEEAAAFLDEAEALAKAGDMTWVLGRIARVRAEISERQGDPEKAQSLAHEALGSAREAGDQMGVVDALELLARLASDQDSDAEAVRLWAAIDSLRNAMGYHLVIGRERQGAAVARARAKVGNFTTLWSEGAKLSSEEAIAYAVRGRGERKRPSTGWASLTPSELEVARLVGQHLSNPEIAARLFVSRATVKTHLVHVFAKLGVDSRSALAAEAFKHS
jgi:predicted ATPase/ATP/maltotriose-dependent transcriptional regulator MalT